MSNKNNSIVTNEFVVVNATDVVMIRLTGDNEYVIIGRNNVELIQTAGFNLIFKHLIINL